MPRVLIAECKQEVSSFNPSPSHFEDFRVLRGDEMLTAHRKVREEMGGALKILDANPSIEIVPTFGASANTSGGILTTVGFRKLCDELLGSIEKARDAGTIDAAYFSLHGAMQAENENDPEGYFLQEARRILGEKIPFVVSLDLHGVVTDRMLRHSDAVVCYHTYPHVDFFETGIRAAKLLIRIVNGEVRPVTARVKIPALVRGDELITSTGLIGEAVRLAQEIEASPPGLSAGVMWGNPFTDVPELRTNSFSVTDGDEELARAQAVELANRFWKHHEQMQARLTSLEESVRQALEVAPGSGTIVMMDAADATSSGASGDSNAIVAELKRAGYRGTVLAPIVDGPAVEQAFAAGVGGTIRVTLGGQVDPARFQPLAVECRVRSLSDGKFRSESFGWPWDSGNTAVLQSDNFTFVVGTRPVSLFDRAWFFANGQDPKRFDLVIVKSPHCEHRMFAEWCQRLIHVDAPGSTSANLKRLGHKVCARPMSPLDEGVSFEPVAEIFRRDR